ncbi:MULTISPECIES: M23 family metallopeptidase [Streptomyces]|uniref:M23ase beta-sheet core domain-containing protein n=1 Tax=Streptomyces luteosporeus TaxID=173856 RepID=A0ABN3TSA3_9ACTN
MRRRLLLVLVAVLLAWAPAAAAEPPGGERAWPVPGAHGARPLVLRAWEPPPVRWAAGHRGVDLAAAPGTPVRAATPGRVSYAGEVAGLGVLAVELAPGLRTTYEPVRAVVQEGEMVRAGQVIGVVTPRAGWHCGVGCVHWGLRDGEEYRDPLSLLPPWLLRRPPSRLLPLVVSVP